MLVPHITVTPEFTTLEAGQHRFWAAIEISRKVSEVSPERTDLEGEAQSDTVTGSPSFDHQGSYKDQALRLAYRWLTAYMIAGLFEFGCLYDLNVEILRTGSTAILQTLTEQSFPT